MRGDPAGGGDEMNEQKVEKVEIEFEKLKLISEYFEFPLAVFFTPTESLKKLMDGKKRSVYVNERLEKALDALEKIREILEEVEK